MKDEIGMRIRKQREALGLSQQELAEKMGYKTRSAINKIEMGINGIPQEKIIKFAQVLKTTPSHLMGLQDQEEAAHQAFLRLVSDQPDEYTAVILGLGGKKQDVLHMSKTQYEAFKALIQKDEDKYPPKKQ